MNYYKEKYIYITGAASGMGLEAAKQLAQKGANLALFDLQDLTNVLQEVTNLRLSPTQDIIARQIDIADFASVTQEVAQVATQWHKPQISFHFAGIMGGWDFKELKPEDFKKVIDVNLFGTFNWLKAIEPYLEAGTQVVQAASMASFTGNYGYTSYGTSKYAVWGLLESLRFEWAPLGIKITAFAPPHVDTPLTQAEAKVMNKAGLDMKKFVGAVSAQKAVEVLLKKVAKKKYIAIPGFMANLMYYVFKLAPKKLIHLVSDSQVRGHLKKS